MQLSGFNSCKGVKLLLPSLTVLCLLIYCIYFFLSTGGSTTESQTIRSQSQLKLNENTAPQRMKNSPMGPKSFGNVEVGSKNSSTLNENTAQRQIQREFLKLLADSQDPKAVLHPVENKCSMYSEFRRLNFLHPTLRYRLCRNVEAYKIYPDGYPMCHLPYPFDQDMLDIVRQGSSIVPLLDMQNIKIQMFVYKGPDYISNVIRAHAAWEPELVHWTLRFALKLPDVTFLDMGSNIGVYSIQAAKLGLPVVSLDANIRNLLRLRLTLDAALLNADLVWNFIAPDQNLKYLSFLADCNVGGAGRDQSDLPDTIPVMPTRSERVSDLIKTKNVVMKMDIQGGEADFLQMSGRLFTDFNVAAVQMEWYPPMIRGNDSVVLTKFFIDRGYKVWRVPGFTPLNVSNTKSWGMIDVMWVHKNFLKMM